MADRLGRAGAAFAGAGAGLVLSCLMLMLAARIDRPARAASTCQELSHCGGPWPAWMALATLLLFPSAAFALLNLLAWRRWTRRRWCRAGLTILIATAALHLLPF